jgi:protein-disulfide isomerase
MLIALAVGYFLGGYFSSSGDSPLAVVPAAAMPDPSVDRYAVPVGNAPKKGGDRPRVTIVEFSDFQCPFCSKVEPTITQLMQTYGKDLRVAWKNNPLPFHQNAMPAAAIANAAGEKGKFWEAHDLLFKNQAQLDRQSLEKYAKELGLDDGAIKAALDEKKYDAAIKTDMAEAAKFGARGTPYFFINGRPISGAQPFEAFKKIVDEELGAADKALKNGVAAGQVYDALTRNAKTGVPTIAPEKMAQPQPQPAQADPNAVYTVAVGSSPIKGDKNAKVTVVIFSDFQCPYCSKVEQTVKELEADYPKDVRFVWKNNPLPFHQNAMPAAEAAMAAGEQGKFWEMHDKMFADQAHLDEATYTKYAQELHLNDARFKAAISSHKYQQSIKDDQALAEKLGARGTPSFFINGRPLRGAQPKDAFKAVIDKEIQAANAALKRGVKPADLYTELTKDGKDKADGGPAPGQPQQPQQRPGEPDPNTAYKAIVGDAPGKGAPANKAKVTIVEWSDFQCPFCGKVEPTVTKVLEEYKDSVRVVFKQLPLPFHNNAHGAAEAALAAKAQGKFWEMHEKMFANQTALDRPNLDKYAQEIGLNVDKFKADMDSGKWKSKVDEEMSQGNKLGARGTPSFFVNGKPLVGAQPYDAFKAKIDAEIANADALIKKGTPVAKVYDTIMKGAQAEVGAAAEAKPIKVEAGNGPSVGPKNAPIQIVEFSDFQCPFCSKVVPTVKQIEEKYQGKVHLTFRNFPLPFHNNAGPAAEAAMAAHMQGKFWEMHDKLFGNQQSLDRASFEKFAGEIGLNVDKFKSDLDSGKAKALVQADMDYAKTLGGMGTPTFFINGRKVEGAQPVDAFSQVIDDELKKKK